jgi:hypothetical protein
LGAMAGMGGHVAHAGGVAWLLLRRSHDSLCRHGTDVGIYMCCRCARCCSRACWLRWAGSSPSGGVWHRLVPAPSRRQSLLSHQQPVFVLYQRHDAPCILLLPRRPGSQQHLHILQDRGTSSPVACAGGQARPVPRATAYTPQALTALHEPGTPWHVCWMVQRGRRATRRRD